MYSLTSWNANKDKIEWQSFGFHEVTAGYNNIGNGKEMIKIIQGPFIFILYLQEIGPSNL